MKKAGYYKAAERKYHSYWGYLGMLTEYLNHLMRICPEHQYAIAGSGMSAYVFVFTSTSTYPTRPRVKNTNKKGLNAHLKVCPGSG